MGPRTLVQRAARRTVPAGGGGGVARALGLLGAVAVGAGAVALGAATHPLVIVGLPATLLVGLSALRAAWMAPLALILVLPVGLTRVALPGLPPLTLVELTALVTVGLALVALLLERRPILGDAWPGAWLLLLAGLTLAAAFTSTDPAASQGPTILALVGILLALVVGLLPTTPAQVRRLLTLLVLAGAACAVPALWQSAGMTAGFGGAVVAGRPVGVFTQPNELGAFTALLLPLGVAVTFAADRRAHRVLTAGAAAVLAAALLLSLSRGAWIGAALSAPILLWLLPGGARLLARSALPVLLVVGVLGIPLLQEPPPQVDVIAERAGSVATPGQSPYDDRPELWRAGLQLVREAPLTGHGPGRFPDASRVAAGAVLANWRHAHNALLTTAAELGIPAALVVALLTVSVARRLSVAARRAAPGSAWLLAGLGAALASQVGHGLVDFPLRNPIVGLTPMLILGLVLAMLRLDREQER